MKTVNPALAALIVQDLTSLCRLWAVTSPDGLIYRYTDHHSAITFEGELYSSSQAFSASATQLVANNAGSDVEIEVLLDDAELDYTRLERGVFDNAIITLAIVSYRNLDLGSIVLLDGAVNSTQLLNHYVGSLAIGPRLDKVSKSICETYTATCRAGFGDSRCKVDLSAHTDAFTVETVLSGQAFTSLEVAAKPDKHYAQGTVTWLTGDNVGMRIEVITNTAGNVLTLLPCALPVQPGDTGTITRGCFHTVAACKGYNNLPNYRGEPNVPGEEGIK